MKKSAILFLSGRYSKSDLAFYKSYIKNQTKIAVDGGYSFFEKTNINPDILIGDFDSIKIPKKINSNIKIIPYPVAKDMTDSQLALELAIKNSAKNIEIIMPQIGDPDHFLGNLLMVSQKKFDKFFKTGGSISIISRSTQYYYIYNSRKTVNNSAGDSASLLPISEKSIYSCRGTEFDVSRIKLNRGETRGLRNKIGAKRAVFELKGEGWLIISRK